ncbi:hypothetical protein VIGAN_01228400 [Vigna angularis var. angularis]|uniref:Uncharacterized protein n=1 Tax=Vigna angularis var. angularis TaxID=157739 RepID=A0A0S3R1S8_PHAAN|nr:hypothetical protein VIGAN_01228400 [Vigna angularis var. angularis]
MRGHTLLIRASNVVDTADGDSGANGGSKRRNDVWLCRRCDKGSNNGKLNHDTFCLREKSITVKLLHQENSTLDSALTPLPKRLP